MVAAKTQKPQPTTATKTRAVRVRASVASENASTSRRAASLAQKILVTLKEGEGKLSEDQQRRLKLFASRLVRKATQAALCFTIAELTRAREQGKPDPYRGENFDNDGAPSPPQKNLGTRSSRHPSWDLVCDHPEQKNRKIGITRPERTSAGADHEDDSRLG